MFHLKYYKEIRNKIKNKHIIKVFNNIKWLSAAQIYSLLLTKKFSFFKNIENLSLLYKKNMTF